MTKAQRRKIIAKSVQDVSELGQISKKDLLNESDRFDRENYDPMANLDDKEVLIPDNRTEVVTIRLTEQENEKIKKIAMANGISKSALIRMLVTRSLRRKDFF